MKKIFLGKPLHWALVAALVACGWVTGLERLHVIEFNLFVILLLAVSVAAIVALLATSRPGEQVTRDPIEPDSSP